VRDGATIILLFALQYVVQYCSSTPHWARGPAPCSKLATPCPIHTVQLVQKYFAISHLKTIAISSFNWLAHESEHLTSHHG